MSEASNFPADYDFNENENLENQVLESKPEKENVVDSSDKSNTIDWHKLAHKLREHNRKLLKKVFQLEQEIIESNLALEEQKEITHNNDLYASKQAQKINQHQEEIAQLLKKVDRYQQEAHSRENQISSLNQQLDSAEKKAAEIAEECAQLQKSNNEKSYELLSQREEIQELNSRINRQQQSIIQQSSVRQPTYSRERVGSEPIRAWSASFPEPEVSSSLVTEAHLIEEEWSVPHTPKKQRSNNSIAAIKLPRFPRREE